MTARTLPPPGSTRIDPIADANAAFDVLKDGGIAIAPIRVGYVIWAGSPESADRVFNTKQRGGHKRHAVTVGTVGQPKIHDLDSHKQDMVDCLVEDYDLPLGVVARYRPDNPLVQALDDETLRASSANGKMSILVNAGVLHTEVGRLAYEAKLPIFASSANLTGTGTKFRVTDIQPEVTAIADLVIDYGLRPLHYYRRSSTMIDFEDMEVIRIGTCYELIADVLKRHFDVDLPADPGREVNPSGHLKEFALPDFRLANT